MKTTSGRTVTRRPARKIVIRQGARVVSERWASSLRQALLEFSKERFGKCGVVVGNVLTINDQNFIAKETYQ
jgi:hypothetical protein